MQIRNTAMRVMGRALAVLAFVTPLAACDRTPAAVTYIPEGHPEHLSDWHVLAADGGRLSLNAGVVPYDLNTPLFSDYAHKMRTIWMPKGQAAKYDPEKAFDFPVGTIITKTFYYPRVDGAAKDAKAVAVNYDTAGDYDGARLKLDKVRLIETRVLVRREKGWEALPYVWNAEQSDAELVRTGDTIPIELQRPGEKAQPITYVVPNVNQCAACHVSDVKSRQFEPLGPKARHLNRDYVYEGKAENQLAHLTRVGYLTGAPDADAAPKNADWADAKEDINARARAYLDINCGHCHNTKGAANTTALHLNMGAPADLHLGLCKPPVAAGRGTGDFKFDIVPGKPDESILMYRVSTDETGVMMPEIGRKSVHREGVELIRAWIAAWQGSCDQVKNQ
ncbi:MAG TPA: SO2930 family diheme c-type cytochrome [Burkholderiaceae bacterium]